MKIEYAINPLETKIFLDDADRKYLRLAIRLESALNALSYHELRDKKQSTEDIERHTRYIKSYEDIAYDEDSVSAKITEQIAEHEIELQDRHIGDCVCFACSCAKCMAEGLIGIDTLVGLGKHEAHKIDMCFTDTSTRPYSRVHKTSAQVLEELDKPCTRVKPDNWKTFSQEAYESHIPRWEAERKRALDWYSNYVKEHGF